MHPTKDSDIHLHNMESIRIIRRKEIWRIRRGGQSTKIISEAIEILSGSRYGVYRAILCGRGLSSKVMGGRFKARLLKSYVKGLLKQS